MSCTIREATVADTGLILQFIRALAKYEKLAHEVVATEETLKESLFGVRASGCGDRRASRNKKYDAKTYVVIAEVDGKPAGFALFFYNYSTFLGKRGIYLEDLFVNPEYRGKGIGKALLKYLAAKALKEGCGRLEWWVLDWNEPSIEFYKSLGAVPMDEWTVFRLSEDALKKLAS